MLFHCVYTTPSLSIHLQKDSLRVAKGMSSCYLGSNLALPLPKYMNLGKLLNLWLSFLFYKMGMRKDLPQRTELTELTTGFKCTYLPHLPTSMSESHITLLGPTVWLAWLQSAVHHSGMAMGAKLTHMTKYRHDHQGCPWRWELGAVLKERGHIWIKLTPQTNAYYSHACGPALDYSWAPSPHGQALI